MKLRAAVPALLVATCGILARTVQVRASNQPAREAAIRQHLVYSERSRTEWDRRPGEWRAAFDHARHLCKLREQRTLQATDGQLARAEAAGDPLLGELEAALGDALHLAFSPIERRLTANLYQRALGSPPPGSLARASSRTGSSSAAPANW